MAYSNYINYKAYIIVDFCKISIVPNEEIKIINQYKFKLTSSCANTQGKLCKINNDIFCLTWGDFTNDEYYSKVFFNLEEYFQIVKCNIEYDEKFNFENSFYFDNKNIIFSRAIASIDSINSINSIDSKSKSIEIRLFLYPNINCFTSCKMILPNNLYHKYDFSKEIESKIYSLFKFDEIYYLVRLKIPYNLDVLHLKYYFLDIIIQLNDIESKIYEISKPIYFNVEDENKNYFGIDPYLIEYIDKETGLEKIKIFNQCDVNL